MNETLVNQRLAPRPVGAEPLLIPGYRHIRDEQVLTRLTGNGNYTWIELVNQSKPFLVSQTLKYFERQLPDFLRVSKSVLLNPAHVVGIRREDARTIYLRLPDGSATLVSRRRMLAIMDQLHKCSCSALP